jgi:hypothetical protein
VRTGLDGKLTPGEPGGDEPGSDDAGVPGLPGPGRIGLSGGADTAPVPPPAARGIAAQVVANTSLLVAVLVYMGWAYDDAFYGYFHLSPLNLDVNVVEYMLRSLSLFSPNLIIAAVVIVAVTTTRTWGLGRVTFAQSAGDMTASRMAAVPVVRRLASGRFRLGRPLLTGAGAMLTAVALTLAWTAGYIPVNTYLVLALLSTGPLLLTWPARTERHGHFPYSLAIVVTAVCALWATALYAHTTGIRNAEAVVRGLQDRTAVVVYSMQALALEGPGVTVQRLGPGFLYHYEYQGLRLLTDRAGTYYLVPVGWSPQMDITYILSGSDPVRIELVSAVTRSRT